MGCAGFLIIGLAFLSACSGGSEKESDSEIPPPSMTEVDIQIIAE